MEGPAVRVSVSWLETEHLQRVVAAMKARDDEALRRSRSIKRAWLSLLPAVAVFRDSVTLFPSYLALLIPSLFTSFPRFFQIIPF